MRVKVISKTPLESTLEISNTNHIEINTLRRIIFKCIPVHGWSDITIKENSSVYAHNDYLKKRLEQFPVFANNDRRRLHALILRKRNTILMNEQMDDITDMDVITMSCNIKHQDPNVECLYVTTEHCTFYKNGKEISNPYTQAIQDGCLRGHLLILKMRYNEELNFIATSGINCPLVDARWNCANCFFREITPTKYEFIILSYGQIPPIEIFARANIILEKKLMFFTSLLENNHQDIASSKNGEIMFPNDSFILTPILVDKLQQDPRISYAGFMNDTLLNQNCSIKFNSSTEILNVIRDVSTSIISNLYRE